MNTRREFRWGIVGTGGIARQFADDLSHVPGARLAAVCSRSLDTARAFAPGARQYTELEELLRDAEIDAVYLATPNHLHARQALEAIRARKPVLVEKPIATSPADAQRIFDAAAEAGVMVMEAMWTRFLPAVRKAKELLGQGAIGVPQRIEADLAYFHDPDAEPRFYQLDGGGASLDLGVYPLSLAMYLCGDPGKVHGRWMRGPGGVDSSAVYDLKIGSAQATLTCAIDREGTNIFTVYGSSGALRIHAPFLGAQRLTVFSRSIEDVPMIGTGLQVSGLVGRILARLPIPGRRIHDLSFVGTGLQFEASAFADDVLADRTVSAVATPAHSIAVQQAIQAVLSQPPAS